MEIIVNVAKILETIKNHGGAFIEAGIIQAIKNYAGNVVLKEEMPFEPDKVNTVETLIKKHADSAVPPAKRTRRSRAQMEADALKGRAVKEAAKAPVSTPLIIEPISKPEETPVEQTLVNTGSANVDSLFNS